MRQFRENERDQVKHLVGHFGLSLHAATIMGTKIKDNAPEKEEFF